jgi:hypothetical protein
VTEPTFKSITIQADAKEEVITVRTFFKISQAPGWKVFHCHIQRFKGVYRFIETYSCKNHKFTAIKAKNYARKYGKSNKNEAMWGRERCEKSIEIVKN